MHSGFVSIIGRPNVGKSTLLNTVIGEKIAIVSNKPQTTRNRLQGIYTSDKGQIIFVDTPGIHKPKHLLGEYMVSVSERSLAEVDLVYYVVDVTQKFGGGEQYIIDQLQNLQTPVFLILNKIDLVSEEMLQQVQREFTDKMRFAEIIPLSALTKENMERLLDLTFDYLPPGPLYYPKDDLTDQPIYFLVMEIIREKALLLTHDEIPHSLAVEIEEFKNDSKNRKYIRAFIYTERDSQKGIIIGKQGQMLKEIGSLARADIEALLNERVYLDLWVKVKKKWRDNEAQLKKLGYKLETEHQ